MDSGGLLVGVVRFDGGGGNELSDDTDGHEPCSARGIGGGGGSESIEVLLIPSWDETLLRLELAW